MKGYPFFVVKAIIKTSFTCWHSFYFNDYMNTLFPVAPEFPPGFHYYPDFINEAEEAKLVSAIRETPLHTFHFQGYEAKRKVASFGYDWSFEKRVLSKGKQIPQSFSWVVQKVAAFMDITPDHFAELLVTEYPVGSVINWHRDAPPFDIIAGISLHTDCVFRLRPQEKAKQNRKSVISFTVQRRSLYIIQGTARTEWQHSTSPVKEVRYSITLRSLKSPV
ncbi:Alkylated DNA repair dioxygenase AlkB [Flavisolibacter ginsengisoli DSM 18119]|uniref:Alkylated DNA repair dioxygenase AlkB n=2 Tax=Flavisolibacter TaxID=398041 RepID=A0A1M4YER1_9BACT|nr:Alkylated DNA repair dioxygenase AlkB [Flavisolibacter ginsengisoli DSM 18119]